LDLSRPVIYRGLNLNGAAQLSPGERLYGAQIAACQMGNVAGVGWTEKRSLGDGNDASDVFLGARRVLMSGHVYGRTRAEMFDFQQALLTTLSPTSAYNSNLSDFGYNPLFYSVPTEDTDYPEGVDGVRIRALYMNLRPLATPTVDIIRDASGGIEASGSGIAWSSVLEGKDPRVYVFPDKEADLSGSGEETGTFFNRGDYPAPLNLTLVVAPSTSGTFHFVGAGSNMRITVPAASVQQVFRYDGYLHILKVETNGLELLRMDLLSFTNETTHPVVQPGTSDWTTDGPALDTGSRLWWAEAYS
jgi:hypothetical protein